MTVNEKMIARIDAVFESYEGQDMSRYSTDDRPCLEFIREQLTPEAVAKRTANEGTSVTHLIEVAAMRLKPYETKETTSQ